MTQFQPFACQMPAYAADRPTKLTDAQALALYEVLRMDYADGDDFSPYAVFGTRDNQDNARRRSLRSLALAGKVLRLAVEGDPEHCLLFVLRRPEALAAYRAWYARRGEQFDSVAAL